MSYPLPWTYRSAPRPQGRPAPPPRAVLPALAQEFENRPPPWASYGELAPMPAPQPTTSQPGGLQLEPPEWVTDPEVAASIRAAIDAEPQGDQLTAVDRLKLEAGDVDEPPPFRGIVPASQPLLPAPIPEVDWRAEELERARAAEPAVVEETPGLRPPPIRETP